MLMDKFLKLGLSEEVLKSLVGLGIEEPTDIQEKAIPEILKGKNVIGKAETGTGKTLAYLLPIIEKFDDSKIYNNVFSFTTSADEDIEYLENEFLK